MLNGAFRETVLTPRFAVHIGHILNTISLCVLIFLITWLTIGWLRPTTMGSAIAIGALWLALTVAFEFLVGHYFFHKSWESLLADYNVARGRI